MLRHCVMLLLVIECSACESHPKADAHTSAASALTDRYARSPLNAWDVRGSAAGSDCDVLLVETSVVMNDAMIEALHYGPGEYGVVAGGVQRFYRERAFRAVAYRDSAGHLWRYGEVSRNEAETLKRCD